MIFIIYKCIGIKKNEVEIIGEIILLIGYVFWDYLYVMNFFQVNDILVGEWNGKSKFLDDMIDIIGYQFRQYFDDIDFDVIVGVSY